MVWSNQNIREWILLSTFTGRVISVVWAEMLGGTLDRNAYKYNNQRRGGLDQVCATRMYRSIGP